MSSDIYQSPSASLTEQGSTEGYGSLDRAVVGDYELSMGSVLSEAWAKTSGAKWTIHLALVIYMAVYLLVGFGIPMIIGFIFGASEGSFGYDILVMAVSIAAAAISLPMGMGLFMIGLRRSLDAPISANSVMEFFHKTIPLFITMLIMYIMILLGLLLLVIPGIYLMIAYYFAAPLVVEKGLSPWQALEISRKAVTRRWFSIFFIFFVLTLIVGLSAIPLFIGTIWTIPMAVIVYGIMYRNMFGYEPSTVNS